MPAVRVGIAPNHGRFTTRQMLLARTTSPAMFAALQMYVLGVPLISLSGSFSQSTFALATLRLDEFGLSQAGFILDSATRTAVIYPGPADDNCAVRLVVANPDHKVLARLRSSQDGRHGYEVGVVKGSDIDAALTAGNYYAVIRRVAEAQKINDNAATGPTYAVPAGVSDTPSSGFVYADVNSRLTSGQQFTIDARIVSGTVELRINEEETPTLRHDTDVDYTSTMAADIAGFGPSKYGSFENYKSVGFVSSVAGATVISAAVYSLQGQTTSQREILVAVSAGDVWVCVDGSNMLRVASGAMAATGDVEAVAFEGTVRMLGGGRARKMDVVSLQVSNWTPTAGSLPGQTGAGTCTGTLLTTHGTRIAIGGVPGQENNVYESAVADADDFDDGSELPGHAYILAGVRPLKIGDAITCLQEASNSTLICGGENSIQAIIGDPALGNFDTTVLEDRVGIGGARSMVRLQDGLVIGHGEHGVVAISPSGGSVNISRDVLTAVLSRTTDELGQLDVVVARDPQRHWVHVFMTPKDGSNGRHVIIDERKSGMAAGRGGFYEQSYPAALQPTCAEIWNGQLVLGCLDGYLRVFDNAAASDDGESIGAVFPIGPFKAGNIRSEVAISYVSLMLTEQSGPVQVKAYAGVTPESAFDTARRSIKMNRTIGPWRHEPIPVKVRGPSLVLEVSQTSASQTFRVEQIDAKVEGFTQETSD